MKLAKAIRSLPSPVEISAKGSSSHGFVAQSMGGGGGTGGFNVSGTASGSGSFSGGISVGLEEKPAMATMVVMSLP